MVDFLGRFARMYDISNGKASSWSWLLGSQFSAFWHTSGGRGIHGHLALARAKEQAVDGSEIPFPTTVWMYKTM